MKFNNRFLPGLLMVVVIGFVFQSCASSGNAVADKGVKVYSKSFNEMKGVVRDAIKGSNLNIEFVNDNKQDKLILLINKLMSGKGSETRRERGTVEVIKLSENKTRVRIENPEYEYSVPNYQKTDYQRIIFREIENIIGDSTA